MEDFESGCGRDEARFCVRIEVNFMDDDRVIDVLATALLIEMGGLS